MVIAKIRTDEIASAHLAVWGPVSGAEWNIRHPQAFPADGLGRDGDSIRQLRRVMGGGFFFATAPTPLRPYGRPKGPHVPQPVKTGAGPIWWRSRPAR